MRLAFAYQTIFSSHATFNNRIFILSQLLGKSTIGTVYVFYSCRLND